MLLFAFSSEWRDAGPGHQEYWGGRLYSLSLQVVIIVYSLKLSSVMLTAAAVACWHVTQHYEQEVLEMAPFYRSWEPVSHWLSVSNNRSIKFLTTLTNLLFITSLIFELCLIGLHVAKNGVCS